VRGVTSDQLVTVLVLAAVIAALIWDKVRADVVALAGAAVLLVTGVVRPSEVQSAFASPALIALASLFVIVYAIELSGLLDRLIGLAVVLCRKIGAAGLWITIGLCGAASAFLNNTPIVVLSAPIIRDSSQKLGLDPKRFLIPLSYISILGGCCTLIGTSTNLLVADMARVAGQPSFGLFEITPVGLAIALVGALYLLVVSRWLAKPASGQQDEPSSVTITPDMAGAQVGAAELFERHADLQPRRAALAVGVFVAVIAAAALEIAPIAASAAGRGGAADPVARDQRGRSVSWAEARDPDADRRHGRARHRTRGKRPGRAGKWCSGRRSATARAAVRARYLLRRHSAADRDTLERDRGCLVRADRGGAGGKPWRQSPALPCRGDDGGQRGFRDAVRLPDQRAGLSDGPVQLHGLRPHRPAAKLPDLGRGYRRHHLGFPVLNGGSRSRALTGNVPSVVTITATLLLALIQIHRQGLRPLQEGRVG
jgi:Ni/Co efflux regulator RcnB